MSYSYYVHTYSRYTSLYYVNLHFFKMFINYWIYRHHFVENFIYVLYQQIPTHIHIEYKSMRTWVLVGFITSYTAITMEGNNLSVRTISLAPFSEKMESRVILVQCTESGLKYAPIWYLHKILRLKNINYKITINFQTDSIGNFFIKICAPIFELWSNQVQASLGMLHFSKHKVNKYEIY